MCSQFAPLDPGVEALLVNGYLALEKTKQVLDWCCTAFDTVVTAMKKQYGNLRELLERKR